MITLYNESMKAVLRIKNMGRLTQSAVEYGAYTTGKQLIREANKEILRRPKKGRTYIRKTKSGARRRHTASAPGETHANMTGTLRKSLSFKVGKSELEFGYGIQKNDDPMYAGYVEKGTKRMDPRPSLNNAIRAQRRNFQNNFDREIGKRLEGKGF